MYLILLVIGQRKTNPSYAQAQIGLIKLDNPISWLNQLGQAGITALFNTLAPLQEHGKCIVGATKKCNEVGQKAATIMMNGGWLMIDD